MLQMDTTKEGMDIGKGNAQTGEDVEKNTDISTEDHTQETGCTNDATVHDHSRAFTEWQQKVKDEHWIRMSMEIVDEGLPN